MPLHFGEHTVSALHLGSTPLVGLYRGSTLVWSPDVEESGVGRDDFPANGVPSGWVDEGPSPYGAVVVNGLLRAALPGGYVSYQYTRQRWSAHTAAGNDYEFAFRVGSQGSSNSVYNAPHDTHVLARVSNGDFTHGVGVRLVHSGLAIIRRVSDVTTTMKDCGAFTVGDVIRVKGVGNLHEVWRNGDLVGDWNDTGATASSGSGYRSLGVVLSASREAFDIFAAPRFSPTIDYVELR